MKYDAKKGDKIHVIMRRQFEEDIRRHFIGEVLEAGGCVALVEGYVFVFIVGVNEFVKKTGKRKRIVSLVDSRNNINIISEDAEIDNVKYMLKDKQIVVTDEKSFELDIHEFGSYR